MKAFITLFFLFTVKATCFAQKDNYVAGGYVTLQGDSVKGAVSVLPNTRLFRFKSESPGHESGIISIDTIKSIQAGKENYAVWYGTRTVTYVDPIEMDIKNIDSSRTEYLLLRQEYSGKKFQLYSYTDETDRFFIGYDGKLEELLMKYRYFTAREYDDNMILPNMPKYTSMPIFRDQTIAIMAGVVTGKQRQLINTTQYNRHNLSRMLKALEK